MPEYKILQGQPGPLQNEMNSLAREGWEAVQIAPVNNLLIFALMKHDPRRREPPKS